jgi:hypothetical protein
VLRIDLAPAGKRTRRLYIASGGLRATGARFEGSEVPIETQRGIVVIELSVDAKGTLEVDFAPDSSSRIVR